MPGKGKILSEVLSLLPSGMDESKFIHRWRLSELYLPAVLCESKEGCGGCKRAGGLYLRCGRKCSDGEFCKSCTSNFVSIGRPKNGVFSERVSKQDWRTEEGIAPITFMQYLKKNGMTREDGEEFLNGKKLPEHEWELPTRGRRSSAVSDTSSEGGRGKGTSRYLPLDSYNGVSPSDQDKAHKGKNGKILRVNKYSNGTVRKMNVENWTDEANEKFIKMYQKNGESGDEGFEETKKRGKKKHQNDEGLDEMRALLEQLQNENAALKAAATPEEGESKGENKAEAVDEAALKKEKKARLLADKKKKKKAALAAKKKAEQEEKLKKMKDEAAALQAAMASSELEEEEDEDEQLSDFDSSDDEEEVEFNAYEHDGTVYHYDEEEGSLTTEDSTYFGYIDEDGKVHEGEKPEDE